LAKSRRYSQTSLGVTGAANVAVATAVGGVSGAATGNSVRPGPVAGKTAYSRGRRTSAASRARRIENATRSALSSGTAPEAC